MKNALHMSIWAIMILSMASVSTAVADTLDTYNIVWDTQSSNSAESMPVGGGDIGLNVWVEDDEILFYIGRSGAFDENNHFVKLGRVPPIVTVSRAGVE